MLERTMEDLIAQFPDELFPNSGLTLVGRQKSFKDVGRFDLLFRDRHGTRVLMELKARVAKYEDATQLARYKDELERRGTQNVLMWLIAPQIPNSVREFLDRIGIEYSEIHEAQFRRVAERHGIASDYSGAERQQARAETPTEGARARYDMSGYEFHQGFNRAQLDTLLKKFEAVAKRRIDVSLARSLRAELLTAEAPSMSTATIKQLARWCDTDAPIYADGMEVARKISELLFGKVLDRTRLGV
jgi:Endonuclease NucS C-terminal domain